MNSYPATNQSFPINCGNPVNNQTEIRRLGRRKKKRIRCFL